MTSVVVVGGGLLGLAVARALLDQRNGLDVAVLEKDEQVGTGQSGHNSGVVHAGLYYPPGSLKASLCLEGRELLKHFCREHGVAYESCGKVVVALDDREREPLQAIFKRAKANGVSDAELISGDRIREIEPNAAGIAAVWSPSTAIVDYPGVCRALAADVIDRGGRVICRASVSGIHGDEDRVTMTVDAARRRERYVATAVIVCGGLFSDRLAASGTGDGGPKIVPFRGEYYELVGEHRGLVRGLIYPVPDPRYPFLGIHLTRRVDGSVLVGPNAILALAREGYRWRDIRLRDLAETLRYPGFRAMAREHWRTGVSEMRRSLSKRAFVSEAQRYVPDLQKDFVKRAPAGVRAQALDRDGRLVDDFVINRSARVMSVRNAPSPAATSSLAIGRYIAQTAMADGVVR